MSEEGCEHGPTALGFGPGCKQCAEEHSAHFVQEKILSQQAEAIKDEEFIRDLITPAHEQAAQQMRIHAALAARQALTNLTRRATDAITHDDEHAEVEEDARRVSAALWRLESLERALRSADTRTPWEVPDSEPQDPLLSRLTQFDERERRYDVRSLYETAQQTDPWPGASISKRWYEGEVPDQGAEGSSVGYAMAGYLAARSRRDLPRPWDGHACSAMLPAPHARFCNWCGTQPTRDVSQIQAVLNDTDDDVEGNRTLEDDVRDGFYDEPHP